MSALDRPYFPDGVGGWVMRPRASERVIFSNTGLWFLKRTESIKA
jgi:hypothetical protein